MKSKKQYIVVHSGARDLYEVALALFHDNSLGFLVTDDIYFRKKYRNLLPTSKIKISYIALFFRFLLQINKKMDQLHLYKDFFLGRTAGKLSRKYNMPLLAYSEYAYHAYKYSDVHPRILFQFHPHALSNKRIYEEEMTKHPEVVNSLMKEKECAISSNKINQLKQETLLSDYFICASSFTKRTLIENGAETSKIFVAPYGVNLDDYPYKERLIPKTVNFVFVGSYTERKGIFYLLRAAKKLEDQGYNFKIKMTGKARFDPSHIGRFGVKNVETYFSLNHNELINLLHESDVFILPSLVEGFAFVIIEAMATGLPVISTFNTAGPDIIKEGYAGFSVDAGSIELIEEKMRYFIEHPEKCVEMGHYAADVAKSITWNNFERKIVDSIRLIENSYNNQ